ncbi:ABC-2 type transport system permease protein [Terrimicrobium sacchariphilum]|uniref:ABC-2 type transport system permease protein n=1 Tax=Terrimicrobium sacchariphilum TaxID=690879 RepID=A0A146GAR0_TERSA|nr:ABC transporter permease [Terrimicrobium sacchariphilum]GAT34501.1 ABC-2 type transport system permease protein [Terrimicrobium sacchariphilum]
MNGFSIHRFFAIIRKEFIQMRRDRLTFAMMFGIPIIQLILFGYAINTDPKHLPMAILSTDNSQFVRSFAHALEQSQYFTVVDQFEHEDEARQALARGDVQFVLSLPSDFSQRLVRGERPPMLMEVDATDPSAVSSAVQVVNEVARTAFDRDLEGPLQKFTAQPGPAELRIHLMYNPDRLTQYNIVPGLMGVVLTMTMVVITALAVTRERERGTMESLLATPAVPIEVMTGKIIPYIVVGYVQVTVILLAARVLFQVPMVGNLGLLYLGALCFIAATLAVGITISTLATNQLQAMQMSFFFFLPSLLLSGFMFPFRGMPEWAQTLGQMLPLTHFLRVLRGILLKGNGFADIWPDLWPILAFGVVVMAFGAMRYRRTLD